VVDDGVVFDLADPAKSAEADKAFLVHGNSVFIVGFIGLEVRGENVASLDACNAAVRLLHSGDNGVNVAVGAVEMLLDRGESVS
jgi:hypothetical protein